MEQTVVFTEGEHGVERMRIPGLVTSARGTLLAFCEARDGGDRTPTDLVLKRSEDGGRKWGPLQLVVKARGMDALMDPCPVVDGATGGIHCFLNLYPEGGKGDAQAAWKGANHGDQKRRRRIDLVPRLRTSPKEFWTSRQITGNQRGPVPESRWAQEG